MSKFNIKKVAFPPEHGSWGFVIEPLLLSLLVAYSQIGLMLVIAAFFIFLNHQPVRVLLNKKKRTQFLWKALFFFFFYSFVILISFYIVLTNTAFQNLLPFDFAVLLMFIFFVLEIMQNGRKLFAEFIAPLAITFIALSVVLINGWNIYSTIAFAVILLGRAIPTVLYVNVKVQFLKGNKVSKIPFYLAELLLLVIGIYLIFLGLIPKLSLIAMSLLIARAEYGLAKTNLSENVKTLGIKEFIFGILYVIIIFIGYSFNL